MNLRFAGMITGCMLVGASAAAYHRADSRPAPSGATLAAATAESPTPLFPQAATGAPTSAAWPPVTSVAFYGEMFEQLPAATAPVTPAQAETPPAAHRARTARDTASPRAADAAGSQRERGAGDRAVPTGTRGQQVRVPVRSQTPAARRRRPRGASTRGRARVKRRRPPISTHLRPETRPRLRAVSRRRPPSDTNVPRRRADAARARPTPATAASTPQRAGGTPPRENADMVEVVIRDRFGRPIRVERVDRRLPRGRARLSAGAAAVPVLSFVSARPPRRHGPQAGTGRTAVARTTDRTGSIAEYLCAQRCDRTVVAMRMADCTALIPSDAVDPRLTAAMRGHCNERAHPVP